MTTQILVVEDETIVATNIRYELTGLGYKVAIASSGEEALQLAESAPPDLVLMDLVLKGKKAGIEVGEELRHRLDIPVVYLTGSADDSALRRARITEPHGYLVKPYDGRELRTSIETGLLNYRMKKLSAALRRRLADAFPSIGDGQTACSPRSGVRDRQDRPR